MSDKIEKLLDNMDKRFDKQDEMMMQLINMVGKTNERIDTLQKDVSDIKSSVLRIEKNVPEDILGMLKQLNSKLDQKEKNLVDDYSVISDKVADLEADLKLIKKVITNQ